MPHEQAYWQEKYAEACQSREKADVEYVMAFRPKIYRDGPMWCALVGENLQEGVAGFAKSYAGSVHALHTALLANIKDEGHGTTKGDE